MFTGIIQEIGSVISVQSRKLVVAASEVLKEIELGGSIAVNGVCVTIADFTSNSFSFDVMPETLQRTNRLKVMEKRRPSPRHPNHHTTQTRFGFLNIHPKHHSAPLPILHQFHLARQVTLLPHPSKDRVLFKED